MKQAFLIGALLWVVFVGLTHAATENQAKAEAYLERFTTFQYWSNHLPKTPDLDFLAFIDSDKPLAKKLRERWLYLLASQRDWVNFHRYYRASNDITLQCFAHRAGFTLGNQKKALTAALALWLNPESSPKACEPLLELFIHSEYFQDNLITQRLSLALDKGNVSLARYLLNLYKKPRKKEVQLLNQIYQNPKRISQLQKDPLQEIFYLYGLKRLVTVNRKAAIEQWQNPKTQKMLSRRQQQDFIAHMALYQALNNEKDADSWFLKLKPQYYTDVLLEWKIRLYLKRKAWQQVKQIIRHVKDKTNPCWQYWQARAMEEGKELEKAQAIYEKLAKTRQYYGFLASLRTHKKFSFNAEEPTQKPSLLRPYKPFTDNIKQLYFKKQNLEASRLLNDFILELPKEVKSALLSWLSNDLQWHGKSVYMSDNSDHGELNNQLRLRFPLPFQPNIKQLSEAYQIPMELIYAIMRQESGFREDVVSSAGAHGLMQVMPSTAHVIASREKIGYNDKKQLFLPKKNITLGTAYLKDLSKRFSNNIILIAAAYNAGPSQVHYWLKNKSPEEMDIWIETLPWRETRNYLKNVLSFYAVYQYRMQHKADLSFVMHITK